MLNTKGRHMLKYIKSLVISTWMLFSGKRNEEKQMLSIVLHCWQLEIYYRDLETEISRFEQICAELSNIKHDFKLENTISITTQKPQLKPKPILKKERPKVPPKPKLESTLVKLIPSEESPEGTEV